MSSQALPCFLLTNSYTKTEYAFWDIPSRSTPRFIPFHIGNEVEQYYYPRGWEVLVPLYSLPQNHSQSIPFYRINRFQLINRKLPEEAPLHDSQLGSTNRLDFSLKYSNGWKLFQRYLWRNPMNTHNPNQRLNANEIMTLHYLTRQHMKTRHQQNRVWNECIPTKTKRSLDKSITLGRCFFACENARYMRHSPDPYQLTIKTIITTTTTPVILKPPTFSPSEPLRADWGWSL